ncbi:hypothetical protein LINGRAHAP2_LOCUS13622 [Linum grandiflorum]
MSEDSTAGICAGPWDVGCFIEHLCISNLFKFVLILVLCYIIVVFVYLLFKVGIFQCMIKSICKMCWTACATYCYALHHITCCLCNRLTSVRHHRRRRRTRWGHSHDIETGGRGYASDHHTASSSTSSSTSEIAGGRHHHSRLNGVCSSSSSSSRKRKSLRTRDGGKRRRKFHGGPRSRHGARDVSIRVTRLRRSRQRRIRVVKGKKKKKLGGGGGGDGSFKRRRLK